MANNLLSRSLPRDNFGTPKSCQSHDQSLGRRSGIGVRPVVISAGSLDRVLGLISSSRQSDVSDAWSWSQDEITEMLVLLALGPVAPALGSGSCQAPELPPLAHLQQEVFHCDYVLGTSELSEKYLQTPPA